MPRDPKTPFTADEIARSFVVAFLKNAKKELSVRVLVKTAQALKENDAFGRTFVNERGEALTPERITKAAKELSNWNQIVLVSPDVYCLHEFMPKYRTLDDTWMS